MGLSDWLKKIVDRGPDVEDMAPPRADEMQQMGMPTTWRDSQGRHHLTGPAAEVAPITPPSPHEIDHYSGQVKDICGTCKYFELKKGQNKMVEEQFLERLVNDERWKLHHMGAPLEYVGICGASGGSMATTFVSKSCDQYRPKGRR